MTARRAALTAVLVLLAVPATAGAQAGGVGVRLAEDGAPSRGGFLTVSAPAGGTGAGAFRVTNTTASAVTVAIYAADALTGTTTGIVYGDQAVTGRAGSWIAPDQSSVTVPAGEDRLVRFSVRVPAGTPSGEHVGSVVIQQRRAGTSAVAQVVRVVTPVLVEVPGGGGPQIQLESAKPAAPSRTGTSFVGLGLRNAGGRMCSPKVAATLSGPGESGRTVTRQLDTILARDAVIYPLSWPRALAPGQYRIEVTATGCGATQTRTFVDTLPSRGEDDVSAVPGGKDGPGARTKRTRTGADTTAPATSSPATTPDVTLRREPAATAPRAGSEAADPQPAAGEQGGAEDGGSKGLTQRVSDFLDEHATEALQRAGAPMALLLVFGLVVVAQEAVDRRDPKLRLAPVHRDPDLAFGPEPVPDPLDHPSNLPPDLRVRQ